MLVKSCKLGVTIRTRMSRSRSMPGARRGYHRGRIGPRSARRPQNPVLAPVKAALTDKAEREILQSRTQLHGQQQLFGREPALAGLDGGRSGGP